MITTKEAEKRIRLWNGDHRQVIHERGDGFKFIETRLYYGRKIKLTLSDMIESRNPEIRKMHEGDEILKQILVDRFIHPVIKIKKSKR